MGMLAIPDAGVPGAQWNDNTTGFSYNNKICPAGLPVPENYTNALRAG